MNKKRFAYLFIATLSLLLWCGNALGSNGVTEQTKWPGSLSRFALGSCAKDRMSQPIWDEIGKAKPQLFLFIGDNQYADVWIQDGDWWHSAPVSDAARFAEAYDTVAAKPEFARFRANVPFMGTWDDHDYGANDAGKEFPLKRESQQAFLDFFEFAHDDPIREQEGIYHARTFGEAGQRVQIIMLDTRYHRDKLDRNPKGRPKNKGPYIPTADTSRSILGEEQWRWLEQQLQQPANIRFIVSSIQVVAYEHAWETWGNMPHERNRLYQLITDTKANGVILLTGDRHLTEISVDRGQLGHAPPYPLWDFTISGLTQSKSRVDEANSFRLGGVFRQTHFGTVDIDWTSQDSAVVALTVLDENSQILNQQQINVADLVNK